MKKISIAFAAVLLLLLPEAFSQSKTVFQYPLNDGDLWEYREGPPLFIYHQRRVVGDSILSNGKTYKAIKISGVLDSGFLFQRIDDQHLYQAMPRFVPPDSTAYDEFLLYKLEVEIGDTWPYPGYNYDGFIADSGFVEVNEFVIQDFGGRNLQGVWLSSYTLPDTGVWSYKDVLLLDSLGVYYDVYEGGHLELRGAIINGHQFGTITSFVNEPSVESNNSFSSSIDFKIYPNPVVSAAHVRFYLPIAGTITVRVHDVSGRMIKELSHGFHAAGEHKVTWDGRDQLGRTVASGTYFSEIRFGEERKVAKMMLVR